MADPFQMQAAGALIGAGTQGAGAMAQYQQGRADARNLRTRAGQVEAETAAAEVAQRRQMQRELGQMQAALAQSGVVGGSSADVYRQSAIDAELDALNIRYEGLTRSRALRDQAKVTKQAATASAILGGLGAVAQGVGGIGQAKARRAELRVR